jgi:hypothetical protein
MMMMQQQQQQPKNWSLDRRRGTLGSCDNATVKRAAAAPAAWLRKLGLLAVFVAVAAAFVAVGVVIGQSLREGGGGEHQQQHPPGRFFLKASSGNSGRNRDKEGGHGDAVRHDDDDDDDDNNSGGTEHKERPRKHLYHPGFDLEAWRARVHHKHASTFNEAAGQDRRPKRRISDALEEIHKKKQEEEEMVQQRAMMEEERLNEPKWAAAAADQFVP